MSRPESNLNPAQLFPGGNGGVFDFQTVNHVSLVEYTGSPFNLSEFDDSYSGSVTLANPTAVTPEPSSILLLAPGLLGITGVMRRRFVKSWLKAA